MAEGNAGQPDKRDMTDMTVSQAAALLGVSSRQVHRYIDRGTLPSHWVNGSRGREKRIAASAVADLHGQRDALDEPALTDTSVKRDMADKRDMTVMSGQRDLQDLVTHPAVRALIDQAVTQATVPLAAELARREETIDGKDATIERQAEELGVARERARRAQADADQARAQLQAEQEKRETEAYAQANALLAQIHARQRAEWKALHRPWWWRFLGR